MDRDEQLTSDFKASEFLHSETAAAAGIPFPDPPETIAANIRKTAAKAQEARDILAVPISIHNGWRPDAPVDINKLVGGSPTSAHVEGLAADLFPVGMPLLDAIRRLTAHPTFMLGVDQIINERGCVHLGLPCKASGYEPRREVRTESWTRNAKTGKDERHYPLLYVWKPKPEGADV